MSDHLLLAGTQASICDTPMLRPCAPAAHTGALPHSAPHIPLIRIEAASGPRLAEVKDAWGDLCRRADTVNVFMNPSLVALANQAYPALRCFLLLAWDDAAPSPKLLGAWALAIARATHSPLPVRMLCAPPMPNAYLSTPVVDRNAIEAVLSAMIEHIEQDGSLPKIVALDAISAETATAQTLNRLLQARRAPPRVFSLSRRPHLTSELGGKAYLEKAFSGSSRKKLRQQRRRLAEKGALTFTIVTDPPAVRAAFDDFLTLEASGWKGRQQTALSCSTADAQFSRAMIAALAANGEAAIHTLSLDARPVSMQIVLRCGATAFTWKTAYDEQLHDFSPGTLLLEDYTVALLEDPQIHDVDSCSYDDSGYMRAWLERAEIANLWFDARRGGSASFLVLSRLQAAYLGLRTRAKALYHDFKQRKQAKK